jgi:lantibiotic biosynthesis protein
VNAPLRAQSQGWRTAALDIARQLAAEAVWSDGICAFHGATAPASPGGPPRIVSVGADMYEGSAGIARFLGMAAALSGDSELRETAVGALRHAQARVDGWSLFTGGMGVGLATLELAELLEAPDLVVGGVGLIERSSAAAAAAGAPFDLLAGTAGVVVGLVKARKYDPDGGWVSRAFELGRQLLAAGIADGFSGPDGPPLSWPLDRDSAARLCGLAHGASGVALAFGSLAGLAPEERGWQIAARRARAYERAHYSPEAGSWADLRPREPGLEHAPPSYPHMWCHGSIGVVAERLGAVEHDLLARADAVGGLAGARVHAERLLAAAVGPGASDLLNASLCHGLGSLIDVFVDTWRFTGEDTWMQLAGRLGDLVLNDARRIERWRSGVPGGLPAPGLMLGSAGAAWALMRLAEPERVPSGWRIGDALAGVTTS